MKIFLLFIYVITFYAPHAHAMLTVFDKDDWKLGITGFVELDSIYDSTRSFNESPGNTPVSRFGTTNGDNGRTQMSLRNSRLALSLDAPEVDEWKTNGYIETDFLGYDPSAPAVTENAYFTNPTLRLRHAYFSVEKNGWQILAGQTWSLFGWQSGYFLSTVSVAPVAGMLYQRTPRASVIKTIDLGATHSVQTGVSLERPTQRDSTVPNVQAALKWMFAGRKSAYATPTGWDPRGVPMSVEVSGTFREYEFSNTIHQSGEAIATDIQIPILESHDKDLSNSITLTGEFTYGTGYGDEFSNWTGGLPQLSTASNPPATTNLDPGLGGATQAGGFALVDLQTFNGQLQYFLNNTQWFTIGYAQLSSSNMAQFIPSAGIYDKTEVYFVNAAHDFTPHVRVALEAAQFVTHYLSDLSRARDNRVILSGFFRF